MEDRVLKKQKIGMLVGIYLITAISFFIVSYMELNKAADGNLFSLIFEKIDLMIIFFVCIIVWLAAAFIYCGKRILNYLEDMDLEKVENAKNEVPSMHRPAVITYLLNREEVKGKDVTATILDLINRKYLILEEGASLIDVLDVEKSVAIAKNPAANFNTLTNYENIIIRWIIDEIGDSKYVRTALIRKTLMENPLVAQKLKLFQDEVKKEVEGDKLFVEKKKSNITIYIAIVLVLLSFKFAGNVNMLLILFTLIQVCFLKIIFKDTNVNYLTDKGVELCEKWISYKGYLDNLNPIETTNQELIYKVVLGSKINEDCLFKTVEKFKSK